MINELIRSRVKRALLEWYTDGNDAAVYPASAGKFPYEVDGGFLAVPEDIKPERNYVKNFNDFSSNREVYEFPKEEFLLGLRIEQDKLPDEPILNVAEKVILKLQENPRFYSELK